MVNCVRACRESRTIKPRLTDLVQKAKGGDRAAFNEIVHRFEFKAFAAVHGIGCCFCCGAEPFDFGPVVELVRMFRPVGVAGGHGDSELQAQGELDLARGAGGEDAEVAFGIAEAGDEGGDVGEPMLKEFDLEGIGVLLRAEGARLATRAEQGDVDVAGNENFHAGETRAGLVGIGGGHLRGRVARAADEEVVGRPFAAPRAAAPG